MSCMLLVVLSDADLVYITIINSRLTEVSVKSWLRCFVCVFTLSMSVAALDVLTVMETMARVIPTAATTNTWVARETETLQQTWAENRQATACKPAAHAGRSAAYQDVKRHEYRAGGQTDLSASRRKLPHQEDEESHVWDEQHHVPVTNPDGQTETKSYESDQNRGFSAETFIKHV